MCEVRSESLVYYRSELLVSPQTFESRLKQLVSREGVSRCD